MIKGFNHITLSVSGLEQSFDFYHRVVGLKPLCKWPNGAYFLAGDDWFCLNQSDNRTVEISNDYTHYAFSVSQDHFSLLVTSLVSHGVKSFKDNLSPGASFYFLDPDGHKLELHVGDWRTRIEAKKLNPWPDTLFFV